MTNPVQQNLPGFLGTQTQTGVGESEPILIDMTCFRTGQVVTAFLTVTGTVTAQMQISGDPLCGQNDPSTRWIEHLGTGSVTASTVGIIDSPVLGVRIDVTSGTGSVTLDLVGVGPN